jgi:CBS domain-containing protein
MDGAVMFGRESNEYLLKRQRKEILESLGRVAVVGIRNNPIFKSYGLTEKLIKYGIEILPVIPQCDSFLGIPCYDEVRHITGTIDVVQVYLQTGVNVLDVARQAIQKGTKVFWIEDSEAPEPVRRLLSEASIYVVEHESLEREYRKNRISPPPVASATSAKQATRVSERMTRNPTTTKRHETIRAAFEKMKNGHFRHLPVVDDDNNLIGMLSDRDVRLIHPSSAFAPYEKIIEQLAVLTVEQAAIFSPVAVLHDASLEEAAELMLIWEIGALPVLANTKLVGIITYSDMLKELIDRKASAASPLVKLSGKEKPDEYR